MGDIIIRTAMKSDAAGIAAMHRQSWKDTYTGLFDTSFVTDMPLPIATKRWEICLEGVTEKQTFSVACYGGKIIGIVYAGAAKNDTTLGEVYMIYIDRSFIGKGIGKRLWQHATAFLADNGFTHFFVNVVRNNEVANSFYSRMNGKRVDSANFETPNGQSVPQYRYEFQKEIHHVGN